MTDTNQTANPSLADEIPPTHAFRFHRTGPTGKAEISLDGHDIATKLSGVQIVADFTGTHVALDVNPLALNDVEFEGVARVTANVYEDDPGPAAAVFLSAIDAETLEKTALARLDLDSEPNATTRAILNQLIEWATGQGA